MRRNFAEGDLVVVILPGGVLPGGFSIGARKTYGHVSERDDLLGPRARGWATTTTASSCSTRPVAPTPGEDARPYVGLDDIVVDVEITPDRGYELSVRGLARELSHAFATGFTDPGGQGGRARPSNPP